MLRPVSFPRDISDIDVDLDEADEVSLVDQPDPTAAPAGASALSAFEFDEASSQESQDQVGAVTSGAPTARLGVAALTSNPAEALEQSLRAAKTPPPVDPTEWLERDPKLTATSRKLCEEMLSPKEFAYQDRGGNTRVDFTLASRVLLQPELTAAEAKQWRDDPASRRELARQVEDRRRNEPPIEMAKLVQQERELREAVITEDSGSDRLGELHEEAKAIAAKDPKLNEDWEYQKLLLSEIDDVIDRGTDTSLTETVATELGADFADMMDELSPLAQARLYVKAVQHKLNQSSRPSALEHNQDSMEAFTLVYAYLGPNAVQGWADMPSDANAFAIRQARSAQLGEQATAGTDWALALSLQADRVAKMPPPPLPPPPSPEQPASAAVSAVGSDAEIGWSAYAAMKTPAPEAPALTDPFATFCEGQGFDAANWALMSGSDRADLVKAAYLAKLGRDAEALLPKK